MSLIYSKHVYGLFMLLIFVRFPRLPGKEHERSHARIFIREGQNERLRTVCDTAE